MINMIIRTFMIIMNIMVMIFLNHNYYCYYDYGYCYYDYDYYYYDYYN